MKLFGSRQFKSLAKLPSGLKLLILTLFFNFLFYISEELSDIFYFKGIFQMIRWINDHSVSKLWFPTVGVLFVFLVVGIAFMIIWFIRNRSKLKTKKTVLSIMSLALSLVGWIISLFYILWGFNYHNPPLESRLKLNLEPMPKEILIQKLEQTEDQLLQIRQRMTNDSLTAIRSSISKKDLEIEIRRLLKNLLAKWEIPNYGEVRVRKLKPGGILLSFSTQGIYIPYVSEGHIDGGLHPLSWPNTMCHEMAHGYGFTGEGTCEFISFMACSMAEDPFIRYSGWLSYYEYLLRDLRRNDAKKFETFRTRIPKALLIDFAAIREYSDRYPRLIPKLQSKIHNQYLKAHGIKEGKLNYNRIVMLVDAWERKMKKATQ